MIFEKIGRHTKRIKEVVILCIQETEDVMKKYTRSKDSVYQQLEGRLQSLYAIKKFLENFSIVNTPTEKYYPIYEEWMEFHETIIKRVILGDPGIPIQVTLIA